MIQKNIQKIVVMGLGYIGLPTASVLATKGYQVLGVDINVEIVNILNSGNIHIKEPDLDILVRSAVNSGNLKSSLTPKEADIFILAVPTPIKAITANSKVPDISYIERATDAVTHYLKEGNLVILESTSPVGTTEGVFDIIIKKRPELAGKIFVAHCPERVLPGNIIRELVDNDRIIGGINNESAVKAKELYETFCNGNIYITDCRTAELAKLAENSYRDVNIAFANELSMICDRLGIDVGELIELANRHPRVNILSPGPGVGGHCIAVDPWFIVSATPEESRLIRTAREVNDYKPYWVVEKVKSIVKRFKNPVIGCLGLTYKANVDDLRESPAIMITKELIASGRGRIMACDPNINDSFQEFPLYSLSQVLKEADILLVLVDHQEFKKIDKETLKEKIVIDTRGIWK
jgi:UDP-N-acetyl-D-mannosaminuronic acid dehydrogenase